MTTKQLEKIYQSACDAKGFTPNDGQFKIWKQTLGWCDAEDLQAALVRFYESSTNFPMPAELKPFSEHARRDRVAKNSGPAIQTLWECMDCHTKVSSLDPGWVPTYCYGITAVPMNHPDYGMYCKGREFKLAFRCEVGKKEERAA